MKIAKKLKDQTDLNILIIGCDNGQLNLYTYGIFPCGHIDLNTVGASKCGSILSGHLSPDLNLLSLIVNAPGNDGMSHDVYNLSFETLLLNARHKELRLLGLKYGQILTLTHYLDMTIQQMTEAWEDMLLEMDSKLMKLAEEKKKLNSGTVSSDFLRLLMFGTPSDELQTFLLHELTDRGLKKLGHSIETSYSNIQKLVLKHLQSVGQAISFHLADLQGMARCYPKFGVLGLCEKTVRKSISAAGTFLLKASQLQQVIDGSIKNFKAFFRWLYVVMKGLSDEPVPPELTKMTQQDLHFVAQFLKENFNQEQGDSGAGFRLEKVGQYLKPEDLSDPPDSSGNPWLSFLEENKNVPGFELFDPPENNKSLLQVHVSLKQAIDNSLHQCAKVIGGSLECVSAMHLFSSTSCDNLRVSQFSKTCEDEMYIYSAFMCSDPPTERCHIMRQATQAKTKIEAGSLMCAELADHNASMEGVSVSEHLFTDISFYNSELLSVLLAENTADETPVLAQVPLAALESEAFKTLPHQKEKQLNLDDLPLTDIGPLLGSMNQRRLDNMKASMFAVSGTRNTACVLFSSRRRVRLFLMDAGDDDDEDDDENDITNQSQDASNMSNLTNTSIDDEDDDENKENSRESARMDHLS